MMYRSAAGRRYNRRFFPTIAAYVVALFGATWAIKTWQPDGVLLIALSILPALPIIAVLAVIGLYVVEETDEYQRARIVSAMMIGTGIMLALATSWGFLEESDVVPHLPAYWAFIVWCAAWGAAQCFAAIRERLAGGGE